MANNDDELEFKIKADISDLQKSLKAAQKETDSFAKTFDDVAKEADKLKNLPNLFKEMGKASGFSSKTFRSDVKNKGFSAKEINNQIKLYGSASKALREYANTAATEGLKIQKNLEKLRLTGKSDSPAYIKNRESLENLAARSYSAVTKLIRKGGLDDINEQYEQAYAKTSQSQSNEAKTQSNIRLNKEKLEEIEANKELQRYEQWFIDAEAKKVAELAQEAQAREEISKWQERSSQKVDEQEELNRQEWAKVQEWLANREYQDAYEKVKDVLADMERENARLFELSQAKMRQRKIDLQNFQLGLKGKNATKLNDLYGKRDNLEQQYLNTDAGTSDRFVVESQLKRVNKQIDKYTEKAKKADKVSPFTKLINQIKRISIYRLIRSALKTLTQMGKSGINNLVQYSDSANETMSNLTASFNQIANTMGVTLMGILQALEPTITAISDALVDMLNAFNAAMAKMSGSSTYTKVVKTTEDYAATLNEATAAFDKFQSLSNTSSVEYEEISVEENSSALVDTFTTVLDILNTIGQTISAIWTDLTDTGALEVLLNIFNGIANAISQVIKFVGNMISGLAKIGLLEPILWGIVSAFLAYKVASFAAAAAQVVFKTAAGDWSALAKFSVALVTVTAALAAFGVSLANSSLSSSASSNIVSGSGFTALADGGFTNANFIAVNENGEREWVGTQAGSTAVVNDTEMSDIMYGAVRDGCYEGVIAAMSDSSGSSASSTASVSVYGDTILDVVITAAKRRGLQFSKV